MAPIEHVEAPTAKVIVEQSLEKAKVKAKANLQMAVKKLKYYQGRTLVLAKNPQFRTVTISTASGAVVFGSVGGAFGTASGIVLGTAAGAIPALFTFGLSLPLGAVVGGSAGFFVGSATGAGAGAVVGGSVGVGGWRYRVQIKDGLVVVQKKALAARGRTRVAAGHAVEIVNMSLDNVKQRGLAAGKFTQAKAGEFAKLSQETIASDKFKVSAASATAGAVAGAGTGAVVGTTAGAALGLIPALFTFGLSIPLGAVVGGAFGTATGAATGAAGGGAIGYGGFAYKNEIRSGAQALRTKVNNQTAYARLKVVDTVVLVSDKYYSSTGGTK